MKLIARLALSVTVIVSGRAFGRASQDLETPRRLTVEKVILTEGDRDVCVADTTNRSDLTPYFARTSSESAIEVDLRACDSSEIQSIQQLASLTVKRADVAALKPFIKGALIICGVTMGMGATGGATDNQFIGNVAMVAPPTMMLKGSWWMGPKMATKLTAFMLACGAGSYYGAKGLKYLMTNESEAVAK